MNEHATSSREDPRNIESEAAAQLERLPGVLAAAVWVGQYPTVREVYIAAAAGVSEPDLREAARNVLRENGLVCPPDVVQIGVLDAPVEPASAGRAAQTEPAEAESGRPAEAASSPAAPPGQQPAAEPVAEEPGLAPPWHGRFLVLSSLEVRRAGNEVTCRVQVLRVGELLTGEAREIDTPAGRARAAARAVLQAVSGAARGTALSLEGALVLEIFGRKYAAVSVEAATARRTTLLSGLVPIERSIEDAACLATLGAIERWLAW